MNRKKSKNKFKLSLFIFRRDLRLGDNTALNYAMQNSEVVLPIFIFEPQQVGRENDYASENAIEYMVQSLLALEWDLEKRGGNLYIFYGDTIEIIKKLIQAEQIEAVYLNFDYTSFSIKRDYKIKNLCIKYDIEFCGYHDLLLIGDPSKLKTSTGKTYTQYSGFLNKALAIKPTAIKELYGTNFYLLKSIGKFSDSIKKANAPIENYKNFNKNLKVQGGTKPALSVLQHLDDFKFYDKNHNYPGKDSTTHLSAAHKFGTISIRQSYYAIKKALSLETQLIKELYWRDFFTYVAFHNPQVYGKPLLKKYEKLKWSNVKKNFEAWCQGKTGFPIIDAGMRQLNETGWMHNRVRLLTASFLIKDLHINWLWGEKYFATKLVDYDPAVNNGNWQWVASTGASAQPYFRIFNPWLQQKKYDAECKYIKQWLPELKNLESSVIHNWFKAFKKFPDLDYPAPIVDHAKEKEKSLKIYKNIWKF